MKISRPRVVELCFRHASTVSRVLVSSYSIHVSTPRDDGSCHVPANWPRRAQEPRIRIPPSGTATPEISTAKKSTTITVTYPDLFENRDRDGNVCWERTLITAVGMENVSRSVDCNRRENRLLSFVQFCSTPERFV